MIRAMPELSSTYLMEQQQILREIRDEIRSSRMDSGIGGGGSAVGAPPPRPNNAFVRSQIATDRVLSDQWGTLSWSNAYRSEMRTGLAQESLGALGLAVAPNTMTQLEFRQYAQESLGLRAGTFGGSFIAMGATARQNELAAEIFRMSPRFARAGDPSAGILGTGINRQASVEIAGQVQRMAAGNLRLSEGDYSTILTTGLESGQFDFSRSTQEVVRNLRQLADTTADLTRVTRMSVQEISQSMGALRQMGVVDVAEQGRIIRQSSAFARVAGVTNAEMAAQVTSAIQAGLPIGMGAEASATLAGGNVALARELTRSGVISGGIAAAGGGTLGIARSITQAQQQFMGSDAAYFALRGGLQGNFFESAMGGLADTGGSLQGMMRAIAGRMEFTQGLSAGQTDAAMRSLVTTQMGFLGIEDETSQEAQDAAFMMLRGRMGDAAALSYARANFSRSGRRARAGAALRTERDMLSREMQNQADIAFMGGAMASAPQRGISMLQRGILSVRDAARDLFTPGASGLDIPFMGPVGGSMQAAYEMSQVTGLNTATATQMAIAATDRRATTPRELQLYDSNLSASEMGMFAGGLGGLALGTIAAGPVGGLVGLFGGGATGKAIAEAQFGPKDATLRGQDVDTYLAIVNGATGGPSARAKELIQGGETTRAGTSLMATGFRDLLNRMDRTGMSVGQTREFMARVQAVAEETGEDVGTIISAARTMGLDVEVAGAHGVYGGGGKLSEDLQNLFEGSALDQAGFNVHIAENAAAVQDLVQAVSQGDDTAMGRAMAGLNALGLGGAALGELVTNIQGAGGDRTSRLIAELGGLERHGASQALNLHLGTAAAYAGSVLSARGDTAQTRAAREALQGTAGDRRNFLALLDARNEKGAALRAALSDNEVFRDVIGLGAQENLLAMGNANIAQRFGLSTDMVTQFREQLDAEGKLTNESFRRALQLRLLDPEAVEQEGGFDAQAKEATVLDNTARILQGLATKLGVQLEPVA